MRNAPSLHAELLEVLVSLRHRPFDFVMWAYPWGEPGSELENRAGPNPWQRRVLLDLQRRLLAGEALQEALQYAIKSGHDVGKTAFLAWVGHWAVSTEPGTRGRCTANTERQLRSILWSELAKWHRLFIARDLFHWSATKYTSADPELAENWYLEAMPWSADNPDAFSGLHNYGGRIIVITDEASGIADSIFERIDGIMREANTELFWFATSNPTRNTGRFYECFNKFADSWHCFTVDSREGGLANRASLDKSISQWGLDSDYVRVRILGEFPNTSMMQLIPVETIVFARKREVQSQSWEPLVLGVDIARYGNNESVAKFRRGKDARTMPALRWRGFSTVESGSRIASLITTYNPDAVFIDEGGVGGGVVDFVRHLGHSCVGVNFGGRPSEMPQGTKVANKRAEMYVKYLQWLRDGGCIEDADDLQNQLLTIQYHFTKQDEIILMSKEDMRTLNQDSPDWADAEVLTFAHQVSARGWKSERGAQVKQDYDPLGQEALHSFDKPATPRPMSYARMIG
jgi:hypothetical protein